MEKVFKAAALLCATGMLFLFGNAQQGSQVVVGTIDSIHSQILGEQRTFWVHLPPSARDGQHPKKKYPVLYLLDGDKNFTSVLGMVDFLSTVNGNSFVPEMIVVGVLNTRRIRDLTPTHVASGLWIDPEMAGVSGGGEAFIAFLEKELLPHIDSLYSTTSYRMLVGHSLGGLIVLQALVHHPKLFSSYIAIDPSMWWDSQRLLHETLQDLRTNHLAGTNVFLGMAHTQVPGMDTMAMQADTTTGTLHPRSILQLGKALVAASATGLQAGFQYYDAETHTSVPLPATYDGLHFIFKDYPLNFQDSYFTDSSFELTAFLQEHFALLGSKYDTRAEDGRSLPPEDLVNNLGFFVLGKKQFAKAQAMFSMNIRNYPNGPVAYQYMGDLYAAKADKANAIVNYKKSLSLKENPAIQKKLQQLARK